MLYEPEAATIMPNSAGAAAIPLWIQPLHEWMNTADARRACIPASSGIMSARAVARHYAALVPGGVDGVELLPPARVKAATVLQNPAGRKRSTSKFFAFGKCSSPTIFLKGICRAA